MKYRLTTFVGESVNKAFETVVDWKEKLVKGRDEVVFLILNGGQSFVPFVIDTKAVPVGSAKGKGKVLVYRNHPVMKVYWKNNRLCYKPIGTARQWLYAWWKKIKDKKEDK